MTPAGVRTATGEQDLLNNMMDGLSERPHDVVVPSGNQ